jgi:hypothetical protein
MPTRVPLLLASLAVLKSASVCVDACMHEQRNPLDKSIPELARENQSRLSSVSSEQRHLKKKQKKKTKASAAVRDTNMMDLESS